MALIDRGYMRPRDDGSSQSRGAIPPAAPALTTLGAGEIAALLIPAWVLAALFGGIAAGGHATLPMWLCFLVGSVIVVGLRALWADRRERRRLAATLPRLALLIGAAVAVLTQMR